MADQWFIRSAGRIRGPFTQAMLVSLKSRGILSAADELSTDKRTWLPATTNTELFPPPAPPPMLAHRAPLGEPIVLSLDDDPPEVYSLQPEVPTVRPVSRIPTGTQPRQSSPSPTPPPPESKPVSSWFQSALDLAKGALEKGQRAVGSQQQQPQPKAPTANTRNPVRARTPTSKTSDFSFASESEPPIDLELHSEGPPAMNGAPFDPIDRREAAPEVDLNLDAGSEGLDVGLTGEDALGQGLDAVSGAAEGLSDTSGLLDGAGDLGDVSGLGDVGGLGDFGDFGGILGGFFE